MPFLDRGGDPVPPSETDQQEFGRIWLWLVLPWCRRGSVFQSVGNCEGHCLK